MYHTPLADLVSDTPSHFKKAFGAPFEQDAQRRQVIRGGQDLSMLINRLSRDEGLEKVGSIATSP